MANDTPGRILEAADALFGEAGFSGVSARDVARRAGVTKASVFYHFGSMERLFERVLDRYYGAHRDALREASLLGGTPGERFHRVVDAYLDFIEANRGYPRLAQGQVASGDPGGLVERNLGPLFAWTVDALAEVAPAAGPTAGRHLFVTFSGAVINYFTYAPVLATSWGADPLGAEGVAERRAHLHWLVDATLARLLADRSDMGAPGS